VALVDDLERIAELAEGFAAPGERVVGILAAEPLGVGRTYLCAYESGGGRAWLALDEAGAPRADRRTVREAASLAGLCELAEESAGGGDVEQLIARLVEIRQTDAPPGIEEAEQAAREASILRWFALQYPGVAGVTIEKAAALEEAAARRVVEELRAEIDDPTIGRCRVCGARTAPWAQLCERCFMARGYRAR